MKETDDFDSRKGMVNVQPARLELGEIVTTPAAAEWLCTGDITRALDRHQRGDWGEVDEHDREANTHAVEHGGRVLSAYHAESSGERFWVITEADRSVTTVLFPDEY